MAFEGVSKAFSGAPRPAVDDVSLRVEPGRFVVLLGPSGCGKTTLLKLVNRLYEPTRGRITVDGTDIHALPAPALRRRIGYVIQQSGLFPHLRVSENIAVVPKLLKWDKTRIAERVDELLDLVGLPPAEYRRRYPSQLSGGEQQRVGLARALAADPSTLLMDEPFGALDAITRARLQDELRRIHARFRQTVLFVTHDIEEAVRLADEIVVMREGRVVQFASPMRIVMEPANAFVAHLVGAEDVLRRLSLVSISEALTPLTGPVGPSEPRVQRASRLRDALGALIESGAERVVVVDEDARPVGTLDLAAIQRAGKPGALTPSAERLGAVPPGQNGA
ncbi:MAG: ABC transporter ATP-binding protein [Chloroflexota bacterium]|nr:ABC transporter ATP-binding protein [Chloroflexota bacterium]MDP9469192.1 ABC transporter ATP-binding protein [Chloroflexota bacterium]